MSVFLLIIAGLPVAHTLWWWWADRRLCRLPKARRWRTLLGVFAAAALGLYAWVLAARLLRLSPLTSTAVLTGVYVWYLVIVPLVAVSMGAGALLRALGWIPVAVRRRARIAPAGNIDSDCESAPGSAAAPGVTRRQILGVAAVAAPPLALAALQIRALAQLDRFRVRRLEVALPALPAALDGLTIAQVSDVHVGRFTNGPILDEIVGRTNALKPDLVVLPGDLIDHALADLPAAVAMVRRFEPADRVFLCEGNHDLFESRAGFEAGVRSAGLRLLLNESATVTLRGKRVQVLGIRWMRGVRQRDAGVTEHVQAVARLVAPYAFPILLAHHPHAFDPAAAAGIPLTLAGHTHGGQLMLTSQIGAGPLLFKYWSGLYRKGAAALVVSNGVGNWLPLRINAPAEIVHVTLRSTAADRA